MSRLADYFVVVGYDREKERSGSGTGVIIQRFPEKNWDDTPFIEGIEWFCQPQGWSLSRSRQEPRFFVAVLTDVDANRHYCACLCFNETVDITPTKPADEEEDAGEGGRTHTIAHHSIMYAPKCLVLVSRLDYIETFRNCLGIMYTVYVENIGVPLETLVGNVLGCIQVPAPGGPQVRFSIGAGDRQSLQPPASITLPVTRTSVYMLFQLMGIQNVVTLWCGVMTEQRVLFKSRSYSRLSDACRALSALMFPFKYAHVYIPLLPAALAEVLNTPTPFLMGVHSSLEDELDDLMDVIIADLDGGALTMAGGSTLPKPGEALMSKALSALRFILQPELNTADRAFPPPPQPSTFDLIGLDKQIRAIFMRLFAQLLQGYRACLTIIRINPSPVITFHRAAFLGARSLSNCQFTTRLLDCMFFNSFVAERGPPWRVCDVWDELYSNMPEQLKLESQDHNLEVVHIQELAKQLLMNENPNPQNYQQRLLRPPEGVSARIHQPPFPLLDSIRIQSIIEEGLAKNNLGAKLSSLRPAQPRIVPAGVAPNPTMDSICPLALPNSARRLEVLRNCVTCIFENKIADARKTFPAALRALRAPAARRALCAELGAHVLGNKAVLQHQQFDLVVRLMNCALQDDSAMDEQGVAAALLPLSTAFCRKLCTGVIQFAYMCIQEHPVWQNQQFWEAAFYQDVQKEIKELYSSSYSQHHFITNSPRDSPDAPLSDSLLRSQEPNALEIAAEQMRLWLSIDSEKQQELIKSEESTIYSQAIHYANRMVYLLVPLEAGRKQDLPRHHEDERASNSITNSVAESDSADAESGFEEADPGEAGVNVIKMVSRFVDKVCTEGGVTTEHIRNLHQMIPGVVHMHMEILEAVSRESKRLPPIQKPRILNPCLVAGETVVAGGLRAFLVADGREDGGAALLPLLPAEGALFLTNYRIIFKGTPCDPFACEQLLVRAFPLMGLTKEKPVKMQYMPHLDQCLQDGLQLRSCTFQLIKVAFDEEVTGEQVEHFRKTLGRLRHPQHVLQNFAFIGTRAAAPLMPLHQQGEKHATLKGLAKKTLLKTARKAGFKQKGSGKRQKYVFPSPGSRSLTAPPATPSDDLSLEDLDTGTHVSSGSLGRKAERGYVRDWQRLGLISEPFRLTKINLAYTYCRSYPALFPVPFNFVDDSIRKIARCYRQGRIPIITWRHQRTGALLIRSSASHHKGVIGMLKSSHPGQQSANAGNETTSSIEQERYLSSLLAAGRAGWREGGSTGAGGWALSESSLSLNSLFLGAPDDAAATPDAARRHTNPLSRAMGTLSVFPRGSGGKGGSSGGSSVSVGGGLSGNTRQLSRWGSLKDRRLGSQAELQHHSNTLQRQDPARNSTADADSVCGDSGGGYRRSGLYIFCEKGGGLTVRGCEAVPVDDGSLPDTRNSKHAFKKLLRACVPSQPPPGPDPDSLRPLHLQAGNFYRLIEESSWLTYIRSIMRLSGAVVDLLDAQGSSVCLSLEDGWDITAQVSSIAQLCLDPVYRTIDGFRTLVEKEWLALGHKFPQRSNIGSQPQAGFTPTFLQFLDVVHQIQRQFPLAFEFNEYYTKFLAYHSVSCRFRTFLLECEAQREELGITAVEDKRGSLNSKCVETGPGGSDDESVYPTIGMGVGIGGGLTGNGGVGSQKSAALGQSVFDYIEKHHQRSPIFFNFLYTPDFERPVLRPQSSIACLDIWDYFTTEELSTGAPYEIDVLQQERCRREERDAAESGLTSLDAQRILVTAGYDGVTASLPDSFFRLLDRIRRLQLELGHLPQKWRVLWDKLELPTTDELARNASFSSALVRSHSRAAHKRSTLDILVRARQATQPTLQVGGVSGPVGGGNIVISNMQSSSGIGGGTTITHPHRFVAALQTTPTQCDYCDQKLWGPVKTGVRCKDCGYTCHERCAPNVPDLCTKYKMAGSGGGIGGDSGVMSIVSGGGILSNSGSDQPSSLHHQDTPSVNSSKHSSIATLQTSSQQYYDQFSSNVAENRTHEGHLYKRGNLLKGWKQRWFVLDSIKHQLRYYDAVEDSHCKGHIDLAEVISVAPAPPAQGPPKKTDSKSFFDLRTSRRTFNFCAGDAVSAQEWIEKLQACLQ